MLLRYREILFGVLFGLGASAIDVIMHAQMQGRSLLEEAIWPNSEMLLYRILFLSFGVTIGWLLWKSSKGERETRRLTELLNTLHRDVAAPATIIHTHVQMLITSKRLSLPSDAERLMQSIYEQAKKLQALARDLPAWIDHASASTAAGCAANKAACRSLSRSPEAVERIESH